MPATITSSLYEADNSTVVVADLTGSFDRSWQDPINDSGTGQLTVQLSDPHAAQLTPGRIVRFNVDGTPRFAMQIDSRRQLSVTTPEDPDRVVSVEGAGHVTQWSQGIVLPENLVFPPYNENRYFNWASPDLDDSAWIDPTVGYPVVDFVNNRYDPPPGWPDPFASWYWSRDTTLAAPLGSSYFRMPFTLDDPTTLVVFVTADDGFDLWVDGTFLMSGEPDPGASWEHTYRAAVRLFAGDHVIAVRGTNYQRDFDFLNIAGIAVTAFGLDTTTGYLNTDSFLFHTGVDPLDEPNQYPWVCVDYPDPVPGFTAGRIIRVLLEENQALGALADWTLSFTDTLDTNGDAWPDIAETPLRVGMNLYDVLRQLAEAHIDFWASPDSLTLEATIKGQRGDFHTTPGSPPVLATVGTPGTPGGHQPNLTGLSHEQLR